jgi:hypothetical protein
MVSTFDGTFCHVKVLEIELDADSYKGMPFVLRFNQTWIKNNTSDFYLDFSRRTAKTSEVTLHLSFRPYFIFSPILGKSSFKSAKKISYLPCSRRIVVMLVKGLQRLC